MEKLTEKQNAIIDKFQSNFDKLTFAQQSVLKRIQRRNRTLDFQDYASVRHVVVSYADYHSDYYDAY